MGNLSLIAVEGLRNNLYYMCIYSVLGETCIKFVRKKRHATIYTDKELEKSLTVAYNYMRKNKTLKSIEIKPVTKLIK